LLSLLLCHWLLLLLILAWLNRIGHALHTSHPLLHIVVWHHHGRVLATSCFVSFRKEKKKKKLVSATLIPKEKPKTSSLLMKETTKRKRKKKKKKDQTEKEVGLDV
jgi:hypothetical protein